LLRHGRLWRLLLQFLVCVTCASSVSADDAAIHASARSPEPVGAQHEAVGVKDLLSTEESGRVFVFQGNFWVNLHHFPRHESRQRMLGLPRELSLSILRPDEQTTWQAALDAYGDLARRSFVLDETLVQVDNTLTMLSGPTVSTTAIDPKFVVALNRAAPIYRRHRWSQDHRENQQWIATHAD